MAAFPEVIVYSTPTCPWCVKAKDFLKARGVPFKDVNVREDRVAAVDLVAKTGQMSVPVIEIGDTVLIGFDRAKVAELLGISLS
ncbi:MAG: glutaredoxin family protein [Nanoarchaeota archaeon]